MRPTSVSLRPCPVESDTHTVLVMEWRWSPWWRLLLPFMPPRVERVTLRALRVPGFPILAKWFEMPEMRSLRGYPAWAEMLVWEVVEEEQERERYREAAERRARVA